MGFFHLKRVFILFILFISINGLLFAQTEFPDRDFWSLDAGIGIGAIGVLGESFLQVLDTRLWLSPHLMVGSKLGINYSVETHTQENVLSNILTLEGQVYLRWNFFSLGRDPQRAPIVFLQGGLGLVSAYRGVNNPFDDATKTRGSIMVDAAFGLTIPITTRWHIEPLIRGGYPHIAGISLTAGYKFPLPQRVITTSTIEYIEVERTLPQSETIRRIMIPAIEFIIFGPDIGSYNVGIDSDARQVNELVLNATAQMLRDNPGFQVRIEGHANPFTINRSEADDLMAISTMRANAVAQQLRARGVREEQMVVVAFGGTRNATSEWDVRNRNRRVELMIIQID